MNNVYMIGANRYMSVLPYELDMMDDRCTFKILRVFFPIYWGEFFVVPQF